MSTPLLKLINVSKRYGSFDALNNVDITIERGQISGLIGPNGAGKTTLMKVILSYVQYEGVVEFNGKPDDREAISISYIPEIINFYDYLTGEQVVKLITYLQGRNAKEVIPSFYLYAKQLGYSDYNKLIREHSKGNLRKLMLLQALASLSDILLLDEPFSGLDPMTVEKLIDCLSAVREKTGCTILINTHLFDAAKKLCDNLYFIQDGKIIDDVHSSMYQNINLCKLFGHEEES